MGFIPDEIIEAVRLRSNIVEVVSRYVQLKKRQKLYWLMPFSPGTHTFFYVTQENRFSTVLVAARG